MATGRCSGAGDYQTLNVVAPDFQFSLKLLSRVKPPVINGVNGVSQKAEGARQGFLLRLVSAAVGDGDDQLDGTVQVRGTAWMDHEWFTHQLDAGADRLGLVQRPTRQSTLN